MNATPQINIDPNMAEIPWVIAKTGIGGLLLKTE